jgi:protein-S-isoprenylcysteine O-methyltransferase Ste14
MFVDALELALKASPAQPPVRPSRLVVATATAVVMVAVAIFQSRPDALAYDGTVLLWISSVFVERLIIRSGGARSTQVRSDRGSALLIMLGVFGSIAISDIFASSGLALLPVAAFYVGLVMMVLGIAVRLWAVATLRSFFSYTVQIKEGHHVIESGPYRFVRHPAYAGSLLTILGVGFALQSWGAVVLIAVVFLVAFGYRIKVEERALVASLGDEYLSYARRVKRIVPFVF